MVRQLVRADHAADQPGLTTVPSRLTRYIRLCAMVALASVGGCALLPWTTRDITVSYPDLNARLDQRFPVERNIADLLRVKVLRPSVAAMAGATPSAPLRLTVSMSLDVTMPSLLNASQRSLWGSMRLSGLPRFDTRTNSIFLQDARIDQVRVDNMPGALEAALSNAATRLAKETFEEKPLYILTADQVERLGGRAASVSIEVREARLVLSLK